MPFTHKGLYDICTYKMPFEFISEQEQATVCGIF